MSSITLKNIKKIYPITAEEIKTNKKNAKKRKQEDEAPVEYIEKKPHRSARPQAEPVVKDHHRKQLIDDDDVMKVKDFYTSLFD